MRRRASSLARNALAERGLRGREPSDRHAEWRAGHIVEPSRVAECDRSRIAAMLAADADLELVAHGTPALDTDANELADAFAIDRHEWIRRQDATRHVRAEEARRVVAADAEGRLRQIIGAE